ncbi:MAG: anion permease [Cardiobacteriaceae bacterium]|nr:anion permease [Cardiobacteriaceae bacterium]
MVNISNPTLDKMTLFNRSLAMVFCLSVILFIFWGLGYTHYHHPFLLILAALFGIFMAFNIGGNDVANSFGTSVGAGTLSVTQALAIAAVFEVSGALIAGTSVTNTIRNGIVDVHQLGIGTFEFIYIMMSALIAAAAWLLFATKHGWPVSTTHSIIGAIVGASLVLGILIEHNAPLNAVKWSQIGQIAISWVISPVLGGLMSYVVFSLIKKHVLMHGDIDDHIAYARRASIFRRSSEPVHVKMAERLEKIQTMLAGKVQHHAPETDAERALARRALRHYLPLIAMFSTIAVAYMLIFKGLENLDLKFSNTEYFILFSLIGFGAWFVAYRFGKRYRSFEITRASYIFFSWMQVLTASCFAFSHGSNDIANAIGPFAAILEVLRTESMQTTSPIPFIAMLMFGFALIVGLWFIGKEVIATVGTHLAEMSPASGFTAELSSAIVVLLASSLGLPVSSTHILVGAVLGIGLVNNNANWRLMKPIALAWMVTVPVAAVLSALSCVIFYLSFS